MATVDIQRALTVPAVPARAALSTIMHDIEARRGEWADFALYLNFGAIGLPDVGYVAIPVTISIIEETTEPRHQIKFTLRARRRPEAFPVFEGAVGIDSTGPSNALLWLNGTYEVPLKNLGAIFDHMLARGTAEKALQNMVSELADAIVAHVEQRELADARYRMIFSSGD